MSKTWYLGTYTLMKSEKLCRRKIDRRIKDKCRELNVSIIYAHKVHFENIHNEYLYISHSTSIHEFLSRR